MSDSHGYLTPDNITGATFETKRRGLDPDAVKKHLQQAAATVAGLRDERDTLADEIAALQAQLEAADSSAPAEPADHAPLNDEELTERLGADAVRVLSEARAAAADRVAEAKEEADAIRASAEEAFARRSAEADAEAQRIRANADAVVVKKRTEAEEAAAAIVASAEANAEQARSNVSTEMESADADAARIIREAELTRRQILEDLARRRSAARRQIEQLRAGRERLLASHETVRRALDEISEELSISMSEARAAAETAGHTVSDTTIEELEAEIETARLTGLLDTGPLPVVQRAPSPEPEERPVAEVVADGSAVDETDEVPIAQHDEVSAETNDAVAGTDEVSADTDEVSAGTDEVSADTDTDEASSTTADIAPSPDSSTNETATTDEATSDDAETNEGTGDADLASVVQLDRARSEVDTASHPAKGREASARTTPSAVQSSPALPSKQAVEAKEKARQKSATVTKLESVKSTDSAPASTNTADDDGADDGDVDDIFASLRSAAEKPAPKKKSSKKAAAKKSTSSKKSGSKRAGSQKSKKKQKKPVDQPEIDSSEMARRLKRVLADEQSKAMSTVKAAEVVPDLDGLLGSADAHTAAYWSEVLGQVDDPADVSDSTRKSVDELVTIIRRRVGSALEHAGDDKEAAVASLRSVYREVKTQQVGETADAVCRSFPAPARS